MLKKLRIKFVCINMTIVTIMLMVLFSVLYISTSRALEAESVELMRAIAENPMRQHIPKERRFELRRPYIVIRIDPDGNPADVSGSYFDLSDPAQLMEIYQDSQKNTPDSGVLPDYHLRFSRKTTSRGDWMVFVDTTNEQSALNNLVKNCAWIGGAAFLLFLVVSVFLARWAVKPVDEAWKQQKQFVADASHELKTPLTVIMTNAEFLMENDFNADEKARFSGSILSMCRQMRGLVERLLELARADDGKTSTEFERLNFSEILTDAALPFEPVFFERGIALETEVEPDILLNGNAVQLKQLSEILLDNAQKYASAQGQARVRLARSGHRKCTLTVSNTGEAIQKEDLTNIFKRFYRIDKARGMSQGYGLGLSIAQSIVNAHGGRIWAESKNGVNSFYVEFSVQTA